jgi:nitrogen fixation NifU-like protein
VTRAAEGKEAAMEHYAHPRNQGEMPSPDASASVYNPACGDTMRLMLQVRSGVITDVKWKAQACSASLAAASAASEMVKRKTLAQASTLTKEQVAEALGGLLPAKFHSAVLAADAVKAALQAYAASHPQTA